jgi:non-SMC mitotic condensation complex subunit 1
VVRWGTGVRKNAVMVLSHLILNDMMKVKGHIARLALCLQDSDVRIASLAQLFFHELSRRAYKVCLLPPCGYSKAFSVCLTWPRYAEGDVFPLEGFLVPDESVDKKTIARVSLLRNTRRPRVEVEGHAPFWKPLVQAFAAILARL